MDKLLRFVSQPAGPELAVQGMSSSWICACGARAGLSVQAAGEAWGRAPHGGRGAVKRRAQRVRPTGPRRSVALGLGLRDELLAWKTLAVRDLDLQMQPAQRAAAA